MCGIAGYIGHAPFDRVTIERTLELMANRGPDHRGSFMFSAPPLNIALLHSRLSIIDLDERANQPFTIDDCTLVFNGEIYNYVELRKRLKRKGVGFRTASDTEVLLQYYLHYGDECVQYFEGMWSFAIYDKRRKQLLLSRDRFAEKPLVYTRTDDGFFFGSEIKFLKALSGAPFTVNQNQMLRYLVNGYKSLYKTRETFFENVKEVDYATNLTVDERLGLRVTRYWNPVHAPREMTVAEAVEGVRHHLSESIKLRLRSDVPLAFCLSGGIDSSALVSIAAKQLGYEVSTFSIIDPDERYNEYDNIRSTLDDLQCKHTIIELTHGQAIDRLRALVHYHDAPVYTISYYIHSFLSEQISRNGYRVAISGTGADELLTGYYDHFNLHLFEMRNHPDYPQCLRNWNEYVRGMVRNPFLKNPELYFEAPAFRKHIYLNNDEFATYVKEEFSEDFVEARFCDSLLRNRMLNEVFYEGTRVILHEDDLNSMQYSLENRSPYLDSRLFSFAYAIPNELLIQKGYGKYILREAVKGILNDSVRLDRRKKGFNASIHSIVNLSSKSEREFLLDDSPIFEVVHKQKIEQLLDKTHLPNSYSKFLFSFINSKIFLEQNHL